MAAIVAKGVPSKKGLDMYRDVTLGARLAELRALGIAQPATPVAKMRQSDEPCELDFDDDNAAPINPETTCECGEEKGWLDERCWNCEDLHRKAMRDAYDDNKYESRRGN